MRVLLALLLVGIVGCGGEETSPGDAATPSSAAISPVKSENAAAGAPKTKADELAAQAAGADSVATLEKLGAKIKRNEQGEIVNRGEVVTGIVLKRMGANTKQTIDGINARVEMINQALPNGVEFKAIYDQAELISQAVQTVIDALLLAFIFIIIVSIFPELLLLLIL